jgi:uncharacterized membrane protein
MKGKKDLYLFLEESLQTLATNKKGFFEKLAKGDIQAIKLVFDYVYKYNAEDLEDPYSKYNLEGKTYDEIFQLFQEEPDNKKRKR